MSKYKLSNSAKEDLIRIHHFGVEKYGTTHDDKYFELKAILFGSSSLLHLLIILIGQKLR